MEYIQYNPNSVYRSNVGQHAPCRGQISWGAVVRFNDDTNGVVIASNLDKALVDCGSEIAWFDNNLLRIRSDFIE